MSHAFTTKAYTALELADWRRIVTALYDEVRRHPDPEAAWRLWSERRNALFREHPQSPIPAEARENYPGLPLFPYDPAWRFQVGLTPHTDSEPEAWDIGADGVLRLSPIARTNGLANALGTELTLFRLEGYGSGLFLPFRDATAGTESYGGGRYLIDTIKGADLGGTAHSLILDFNFAYHPSCRHDPTWTCPLAPPENVSSMPVHAGEKL